jgi:hypothetical protein
VTLSTVPHTVVTRTQYGFIESTAGVVNVGPVAPGIGLRVMPANPSYH